MSGRTFDVIIVGAGIVGAACADECARRAMSAWRENEDSPFHTEIGYWLWDAATEHVMRCFMRSISAEGTICLPPDAPRFR